MGRVGAKDTQTAFSQFRCDESQGGAAEGHHREPQRPYASRIRTVTLGKPSFERRRHQRHSIDVQADVRGYMLQEGAAEGRYWETQCPLEIGAVVLHITSYCTKVESDGIT